MELLAFLTGTAIVAGAWWVLFRLIDYSRRR